MNRFNHCKCRDRNSPSEPRSIEATTIQGGEDWGKLVRPWALGLLPVGGLYGRARSATGVGCAGSSIPNCCKAELTWLADFFPGFEPVPLERVVKAYVRSIEGAETGRVFELGWLSGTRHETGGDRMSPACRTLYLRSLVIPCRMRPHGVRWAQRRGVEQLGSSLGS